MKTLLIFPKFEGKFHGFPLGIAYLSSVLKKNGLDVSLLDIGTLTKIGLTNKEIKKRIKNENPGLTGVYITSPNYHNSLELIKLLKQTTKSDIIVGGPHATFCHETILKNHPEIKYVVRGEGEITLTKLVKALKENKNLEDIDGLSYKENKDIKVNKPRKLISNLDDLPFPDRNALFSSGNQTLDKKIQEVYNLPLFDGKKSTTVITSRGCGKACSFCAANSLWGKIRYRSVENVLDELEELHNQGFKAIFFEDDSFTLDKKRVKEICYGIKEKGIDIEWGAGTRVDAIDKELLQTMKNAGCIYLYFGVESSVQEILDKCRKGINLEKIEQTIKSTKETGIRAELSMQFGLEGETEETIKQTIAWLKKVKPDFTFFSLTSLWPGSPLTKKYNIQNEWFEPDFDRSDIKFPYIELSNPLVQRFTHLGGTYHPQLITENNVKKIYALVKKELNQDEFAESVYVDKTAKK